MTTLPRTKLLERALEMQNYIQSLATETPKNKDGITSENYGDEWVNTLESRLEQLERRSFNNKTAIKELKEDNYEMSKRIEELEDYADETEQNFNNFENELRQTKKEIRKRNKNEFDNFDRPVNDDDDVGNITISQDKEDNNKTGGNNGDNNGSNSNVEDKSKDTDKMHKYLNRCVCVSRRPPLARYQQY